MPVLKNQRHELFARLVTEGKSDIDAYTGAGFSERSAKSNAHRLRENEGVKARIEELLAEAADHVVKKTALTESYVVEGLMSIAEACRNPRSRNFNPAAANRSFELLGKSLAMFVDRRQEEKRFTDLDSVEEMQDAVDEMNREIDALLKQRSKLMQDDPA